MEQMIEGIMKFGMRNAYAEANIKSRKAEFKKALGKYEREKKERVGCNKAKETKEDKPRQQMLTLQSLSKSQVVKLMAPIQSVTVWWSKVTDAYRTDNCIMGPRYEGPRK